jgi:hypothetical protein
MQTGSERRARMRYPLRFPVEYQVGRPQQIAGSGWTADLSTYGLQIISNIPPPMDLAFHLPVRITITVAWPVTQDGAEVILIIRGTLVRVNGSSLGISASAHRFERRSIQGTSPRRRTASRGAQG